MSVAFASLEITGYIWMFSIAISYQEEAVFEMCNIKKSFLFLNCQLFIVLQKSENKNVMTQLKQ